MNITLLPHRQSCHLRLAHSNNPCPTDLPIFKFDDGWPFHHLYVSCFDFRNRLFALATTPFGVDTIDLYYCHRVDGITPIEKTIEAMVELKK